MRVQIFEVQHDTADADCPSHFDCRGLFSTREAAEVVQHGQDRGWGGIQKHDETCCEIVERWVDSLPTPSVVGPPRPLYLKIDEGTSSGRIIPEALLEVMLETSRVVLWEGNIPFLNQRPVDPDPEC